MYKAKKSRIREKTDSARANLERVNDIIGRDRKPVDGPRDDSIKRAEEY